MQTSNPVYDTPRGSALILTLIIGVILTLLMTLLSSLRGSPASPAVAPRPPESAARMQAATIPPR